MRIFAAVSFAVSFGLVFGLRNFLVRRQIAKNPFAFNMSNPVDSYMARAIIVSEVVVAACVIALARGMNLSLCPLMRCV